MAGRGAQDRAPSLFIGEVGFFRFLNRFPIYPSQLNFYPLHNFFLLATRPRKRRQFEYVSRRPRKSGVQNPIYGIISPIVRFLRRPPRPIHLLGRYFGVAPPGPR